jgi:hypothetical protein
MSFGNDRDGQVVEGQSEAQRFDRAEVGCTPANDRSPSQFTIVVI